MLFLVNFVAASLTLHMACTVKATQANMEKLEHETEQNRLILNSGRPIQNQNKELGLEIWPNSVAWMWFGHKTCDTDQKTFLC